MKLLTGLFRTMRKKLSLTHDNDMGAFRDKIEVLVKEKDTLTDEDVVTRVEELVRMTDDLPDGDDKEKLKRYLEDMKAVKGQDADIAGEAAKAVADLFEELDKEAMETGLEAEPEAAPEPLADAEPEEEEVKEEEKVADADPDPEYTLEEIYQFIKKRMAEEAEEPVEEEVETEEVSELEDECGVKDHGMPEITLGGKEKAASRGLDDLYRTMKGEK